MIEAFKTTEIPFESIDPEIRTLVKLINQLPGLITTDSCIGHEPNDSCYIAVNAESQQDFKNLIDIMPFWGRRVGLTYGEPWQKMIWADVNVDMRYILRIDGSPHYIQRQAVCEVEEALKKYINT